MSRKEILIRLLFVLLTLGALLGLVWTPDADASPTCDPRWEACNSPVWCETTGTWLGPFSSFCPIGPNNYPPPRVTIVDKTP